VVLIWNSDAGTVRDLGIRNVPLFAEGARFHKKAGIYKLAILHRFQTGVKIHY
jgi:hypothetical protein